MQKLPAININWEKGDVFDVEKLKDHKAGDKVKIDKILLRSDGKKTDIGEPYVSGALVELDLKEHFRGDKIRVFKKKPKKRYERTYGHIVSGIAGLRF